MQRSVLLAVVAVCACVQLAVAMRETMPVDMKVAALQFAEYVAQFNKPYTLGSEEYETRFQNYLASVQRIARRNKMDRTATFAINQFSDMTPAEFSKARLNGGQKVPAASLATACSANGITAPHMDVPAAPASFDWRTKGVVTPVKDQGQCGSCWAFSTIANIESLYAIKGNPLTQFSEQLIVDCSHGCCQVEGQSVCNQGCDGGWPWSAFFDIISWKGVERESDYPYTAQDGTCNRKASLTIAPIKNYTCVTTPNGAAADEGQMAAFLAVNGPLSVALDATPLQDYTSGILNPWFPNYECDPTQLDHAVTIVGYGTEDGTPFWIVKNSWSSTWGENGYFRMYRGEGLCGINNAVSTAVL